MPRPGRGQEGGVVDVGVPPLANVIAEERHEGDHCEADHAHDRGPVAQEAAHGDLAARQALGLPRVVLGALARLVTGQGGLPQLLGSR